MMSHVVPQELDEALEAARTSDLPLAQRLADFADALRRHLPHFAEAVDRLVERLTAAGAGDSAPDVGERLPPFLLPDENGRLVTLDELLADGPLAVVFHRGHWCPYCQINMRALAEIEDAAAGAGGRIAAITPELQHFTRIHKARAGARFPILSDISNGYALSLNLAIWVGSEMEKVMTEVGRDLPLYHGNPSWFLPIPATFVVGRDSIIRARFVDPDYRKRMDADALLAAVAAAA